MLIATGPQSTSFSVVFPHGYPIVPQTRHGQEEELGKVPIHMAANV